MMEGQGNREVVFRGRCVPGHGEARQPTLAKFVCTYETVSWLVREGFATTSKKLVSLIPMPELIEDSQYWTPV